jgi:hypothetical protein
MALRKGFETCVHVFTNTILLLGKQKIYSHFHKRKKNES